MISYDRKLLICQSILLDYIIIVLIEKKDKDKRFIKNWRPISLTNKDAKVASKANVLRIKKVIVKLVHCDQTA